MSAPDCLLEGVSFPCTCIAWLVCAAFCIGDSCFAAAFPSIVALMQVAFGVLIPLVLYVIYYRIWVLKELSLLKQVNIHVLMLVGSIMKF